MPDSLPEPIVPMPPGPEAGGVSRLADQRQSMSPFPSAKRRRAGLLNRTGRAGPRRLATIAGIAAAVGAVALVVTLSGGKPPPPSQDARLKDVNRLPGGLNSSPEQDKLALTANDELAHAAQARGVSYTPPMSPSQSTTPPPIRVAQPTIQPVEPRRAKFVGHPDPVPPGVQTAGARPSVPAPLLNPVLPASFEQPVPSPLPRPSAPRTPVVDVASTTAPDPAYQRAIADMFARWGGRPPRTDVVMLPTAANAADPADQPDPPASTVPRRIANSSTERNARPLPVAATNGGADAGKILVPAGRGISAHTVLALSSDASSPVILQADSGPIAGDRMIGTFSRQEDRLVVHVSQVIHGGETIGTDGLVVAPGTMEEAVASDVDQHYVSRFLLPAAAAFVEGLGQAIATTSNTAAVVSPFGGVTTSTSLNFPKQLGIAAGSAANQIGSTLAQSAPKEPTISLEVNAAVSVFFLSDVTSHPNR